MANSNEKKDLGFSKSWPGLIFQFVFLLALALMFWYVSICGVIAGHFKEKGTGEIYAAKQPIKFWIYTAFFILFPPIFPLQALREIVKKWRASHSPDE